MTEEIKKEITKISKGFCDGIKIPVNGSGWLIVDPLSAYLNSLGYENTLSEIPENDKHGQVLIMRFTDGSTFIPAGGDMSIIDKGFTNWIWL